MKNTFYLAVVFCSVLCSCSKNQITPSVTGGGQARIHQLAQMELPDGIIAFNMLSPEERYQAWYQKTENLLKTTEFSAKQVELINQMRDNLKPAYYKEGTQDSREVNKETFIAPWLEKAKAVFTQEEIYDIGFTLGSLKKDAAPRKGHSSANARQMAGCICHIGSAFTCPHISLSMNPDITFDHCSMGGGECESSGWGCGFNALWSCNGNTCG